MNILITNDDGIYSKGIKILEKAAKEFGNTVIVAPDNEKSGASVSFSLNKIIHFTKIQNNKYIVSGSPVDCINFGIYKIFNKKVDLILSGINRGENMGEDIFYSGTVGAAIEGTLFGIKSLAISLVNIGEGYNFNFISNSFLTKLLKKLLQIKLPPKNFLNINIPSTKKIKSYKFTFPDSRIYQGGLKELNPNSSLFVFDSSPPNWKNIEGSDYNAVINKFVSITPLKLELTNINLLNKLKKQVKL